MAADDVTKFDDPRLAMLNDEQVFQDAGMREALLNALEPREYARAGYSVSAHIWVAAVLTDRALLIVKGAVRAKAIRVPLPLDITREPAGNKKGARVRTPLGDKTLWGSKLDPDASFLVAAKGTASTNAPARAPESARPDRPASAAAVVASGSSGPENAEKARLTRRERAEARRRAGRKPRKPRRQRARATWVGFAPSSTIWDISYNCIKCGRALTNPNSQRHRVGTDCIKRYGSQARKIANPAHAAWTARKTKADVDRVAKQVEYDAEYTRSMDDYNAALDRWKAIRSGQVDHLVLNTRQT